MYQMKRMNYIIKFWFIWIKVEILRTRTSIFSLPTFEDFKLVPINFLLIFGYKKRTLEMK